MDIDSASGPSVSVVMITYNHGRYIRNAIEGVLAQETDFPVELLIGEDHSTDETPDIVREYARGHPEKIRVISSTQNVGAKKNLQRLEAACDGKYTAYCEGDDFWHDPLKLQKQVCFLETNPQYSLVHTEFRTIVVDSGQVIRNAGRQPANLDDGAAFNDLLSGRRLIMTLTVCARTSVLRAILAECPEVYDPRFLMGDTQRWLEMARRGRIKCLLEVTATHLILPESASQSRDPSRVLRFVRSAKSVLDHYIAKYGCPPEIRAAAVARSGMGVLRCAYEAGDSETAKLTLAEYNAFDAPNKLLAFLYYFGSLSIWRRHMVRPALLALVFGERAWRRAARFFEAR
jgi:glycosyltransferase involved in cell wall biosynthesis